MSIVRMIERKKWREAIKAEWDAYLPFQLYQTEILGKQRRFTKKEQQKYQELINIHLRKPITPNPEIRYVCAVKPRPAYVHYSKRK